ncbi:MAG: hypothetical protein HWE25_07535 [Alphaproteobacteria bacterium]|nr:hypothetical protein [Alphaproteobacteria bacterium]
MGQRTMENLDLFGKKPDLEGARQAANDTGAVQEMPFADSDMKGADISGKSDRVPPWEYDAEKAPNSIWWMMGRSGDYYEGFKSWFGGLPADEQAAFTWKYPEPESWRGFYDGLMGQAAEA